LKQGDTEKADSYYQKTIQANRKYLSVYPKLAGIYAETNAPKARKILRDCLNIDSKYKPALWAMAEIYRKTDPEIAKRYEEQLDKLK
jgi:Tfp pilus assembly protein PilF